MPDKIDIFFFKKSKIRKKNFKNQKIKKKLLARAIHRKHFLVTMFKKENATAKELDLRPLGKVIIFRDRQTDRQNLPIIYRFQMMESDHSTIQIIFL